MKSLIFLSVMLLALMAARLPGSEAQNCHPSGQIKGRKPPPGQCNIGNDSDCCKEGEMYPIYKCSPPVSGNTKVTLTINSFKKGKDSGGPSECNNQYHSDEIPIVALSTGWFDHRSWCHCNITINGNGRSVPAMMVDECDSTMGCGSDRDYQPPRNNNMVDATQAVWEALSVHQDGDDWGWINITWSDA